MRWCPGEIDFCERAAKAIDKAEAGLADHAMDWKDAALAAAMARLTGITDRDIMLSDVWELKSLALGSNQISDVSALGSLTRLEYLRLGGNQISDYSPVEFVPGLQH